MKIIDVFYLFSLCCFAINQSYSMQYELKTRSNDATLSSSLQGLPQDMQRHGVKPFLLQRSPATQTLIIDYRFIPAIFSNKSIGTIERVRDDIRQGSTWQYSSRLFHSAVQGHPKGHRLGEIQASTQARSLPFDVAERTAHLQRDPLSFVSFGYDDTIETHVHISHAQKLENLSVAQLDLIIDLYASRLAKIELTDEASSLFHSLPTDIKQNLLKNYSIKKNAHQIVRLNKEKLLPAICTMPCRVALQSMMQEVRKVLSEENQIRDSNNKFPVVIKDCWWDESERRIKPERDIHYEPDHKDKSKKRLKTINPAATKSFEFDATIAMHQLLQRRIARLNNNLNYFIVVGLANGSIEIYFNDESVNRLRNLTIQQLDFIIDLHNLATDLNREIVLNESGLQMFYSLPLDMQNNLQKNYHLATYLNTKLKLQKPAYKKMMHFSEQYAGLIWFTKLAAQAGLVYCGVKWFAGSKLLNATNAATLINLLNHKKKFLAGTAILMGISQPYVLRGAKHIIKTVPTFTRVQKRIKRVFTVPVA